MTMGQMSNFICLVILGCSKAVNSGAVVGATETQRIAIVGTSPWMRRDRVNTNTTQQSHQQSRFTVTVSVRYQYVCGRLQSFQDRCHHSLLTRLHQQKACPGLLSHSRFPTALSRYPFIHSAKSTRASQSWKSDRSTSCETGM